MVVLGTRPEAVKLAPLVLALRADPRFEVVTVVTGQHRQLVRPVLELFGIRPEVDLDIMASSQSLAEITARTAEGLQPVVAAWAPHALVVQGDTTAALLGGLVASYSQVPVVHLEAGLRSGDRSAPFPEELNRRLLGQLAQLHLAATQGARQNLLFEGVDPEAITVVGNTVIDALVWVRERQVPYGDRQLESLEQHRGPVLVVTTHRREAWGKPMEAVGQALAELARSMPELTMVVPLHPNPLVRQAVLPQVAGLDNVWIRQPLDYGAFARLLHRADLVLTDSGGLQEEAPALGKPVLVLRDTTERPEAVQAGAARLVGTDPARIVAEVTRLMRQPAAYAQMAVVRPLFGDGQAAKRSVAALAHLFSLGSPPREFTAPQVWKAAG